MVWARLQTAARWLLVGLFALMAVAHVVLTVMFWFGAWDTGVGYIASVEAPAWLIALADAGAAVLVHRGTAPSAPPRSGLASTAAGAAIMIARASWMPFVPPAVVVVLIGSIRRAMTRPLARS